MIAVPFTRKEDREIYMRIQAEQKEEKSFVAPLLEFNYKLGFVHPGFEAPTKRASAASVAAKCLSSLTLSYMQETC